MASASLARKGSRACFWSNSVSVRLSMDFPMINSPTRFMTASMRAASTRRVLSATAFAAELETPELAAAPPSVVSGAPATNFAACASNKSPSNSCSGVSTAAARSRRTSETIEGMRQRWGSFSSAWELAKAASNELESGGAHQAIGINSKGNVVNSLSAMHGFRNHQLFVFRPGKLRVQLRDRSAGAVLGSRRVQQFANHGVERFYRGRLGLAVIGGEHRGKTIHGGEDQLGEVRASSLSKLRGEHILEFVRQLTELVKSTGSGIALQGMHGAPDTTEHILVSGARLEFEARLVERLKQFVRAFKEESAQLAAAILGRTAHVLTSLRW